MTHLPFQTARIERWSTSSGVSLRSKDIERVLIAFDRPSVWKFVKRMSDEGKFIEDLSDEPWSGQPGRLPGLGWNVAFLELALILLWHSCPVPLRSKLCSIVFEMPH